MPDPTRPTCKTCPYWYSPAHLDAQSGLTHPPEMGECHRHTPRPVFPLTQTRYNDVEEFLAWWPGVEPWRTCGEHPDFPAYLAARGGQTPDSLAEPISTLNLSVRAENILESERIETVGDLVALAPWRLEQLRGFGPTCLYQVRCALANHGLTLKGDRPPPT